MTNLHSNVSFASVDWLTITARDDDTRNRLMGKAREAMARAIAASLPVRTWKWCGYLGWYCEGFRAGTRQDSDIVMLSGDAAAAYWKEFAGEGDQITRLDLAVTLELSKPDDMVLINYWDEIEAIKCREGKARYRFTLVYNTDGGQTLYVGQRSSDQMGRIYDKGVQSGDGVVPGKVWRYEVELKKPRALPLTRQLYEVRESAEVGSVIAGFVHKWFTSHRVRPKFPPGKDVLVSEVELTARSDDTKLHWLATQVRPSVGGLASRGKLADVIKALGLEGDVSIREWDIDRRKCDG